MRSRSASPRSSDAARGKASKQKLAIVSAWMRARSESESPLIPPTGDFSLFMMFATEDWTLGWEFHRPSTRPSSSDMLIVTVPAALPAGTPPRLLGGSAGNGRRFCHGFGLLGGFPRVLRGAGFADLGKRWSCVVILAEFACKTAQKSRVVFAPPALRLARFDDSRTNTLTLGFAVQNT